MAPTVTYVSPSSLVSGAEPDILKGTEDPLGVGLSFRYMACALSSSQLGLQCDDGLRSRFTQRS